MPRKTARISEIRALANRMLAGTDPELTDLRRGVAAMYESIAMAANDYHGYNDIVQIWSGEPGHSTYVPDETYRRVYYGEMSGQDAQLANDACAAYRESTDVELSRRRGDAARIRVRDRMRAEQAAADAASARILRTDLPLGSDQDAWLVCYRGQHFVISAANYSSGRETQVFRADENGTVRGYTEVAAGDDHPAALAALCARPVDDTGYVLSPTDVQDMIDGAEDDPARLDAVNDDLRRYAENAHQPSSPYNGLPVMCGDCGDELVFPVDEVPVHKNDGTPWCQNRDDATRRHPGRFAPGQQPGQSPAPDHNCTQCGCSSGQPRKPVDQELYDRTAPSWTCITEPGQGPHYAPHGNCLWCGMSALGIQEEADTRRQQASGAWHGISRVVGHYAADCPGPELCDQRGSQQVTPDTSDHYPSTENAPGF